MATSDAPFVICAASQVRPGGPQLALSKGRHLANQVQRAWKSPTRGTPRHFSNRRNSLKARYA